MNCPKCGVAIKPYDLSPNCRKCGIHILYYTQEDNLRRDAKKCEIEFAQGRKIVARLKQAYINGPLQIARLVLIVLSIASVVIPAGNASVDLGIGGIGFSVGGIGIYKLYSDLGIDMIKNIAGSKIATDVLISLCAQYLTLILGVLMMLGGVVGLLFTAINLRKGTKILSGFTIAAVVFACLQIASAVSTIILSGNYAFISAGFDFGAVIQIVFLIALFVVNKKILKCKCEFSISDADERRIEIAKKVKSGEIALEDLPLPVVEEEKEEKQEEGSTV